MTIQLKSTCLTLSLLAVGVLQLSAVLAQPPLDSSAKAFGQSRPIPGQYIVVFKDTVGDVQTEASALASLHWHWLLTQRQAQLMLPPF